MHSYMGLHSVVSYLTQSHDNLQRQLRDLDMFHSAAPDQQVYVLLLVLHHVLTFPVSLHLRDNSIQFTPNIYLSHLLTGVQEAAHWG